MKNSSSVIRMALAVMFTAICLGIPGSVASAAKPNAEASVPPTTGSAPSPALPSGAGEVLKMFKGGISKDLIIGYINTTALAYHLSADEIIHLQTMGLPQEVIKAMIERGGQLQRQQVGQRQIGQLQQQRVDQQYLPAPGSSKRRIRSPTTCAVCDALSAGAACRDGWFGLSGLSCLR